MRQLNKLVYDTVKDDGLFQDYTGATAQDPRIYKSRTPVKLEVSGSKPAFVVYFKSGSVHNSNSIHGASKNNYVYALEIYGKSDSIVETIGYRIEKLFEEQHFTTTDFLVNYTFATRGQCSFDEGRSLYFESVTVYMNNILTLNEAS